MTRHMKMMGLVLLAVLGAGNQLRLEAQQSRVLEGQVFHSEALGREWPYTVYLPPDYGRSDRSYPVVYLLHGLGGNHTTWTRCCDASMTADSLIAASAIAPVILVMPDGFGRSFWIDSDPTTGFGSVETAFLQELVPHVDSEYRTIPARRGRMVGGLSMGGYSALRLAFRHPEVFGAAAGLSPAIWRSFPQGPPVGDEPPTTAFGVPFDRDLFEAETPWAYVANLVSSGERLPVYISAGDDDPFHQLITGSTDLYVTLREAGIPAELRITDGGHTPAVWDAGLIEALIFFSDVQRGRR